MQEEFELLAASSGTVFSSSAWAEIFGSRLVRVGLFDNKGALAGGFHVFEQRKWGLKVLRNPPFTPTCGPFVRITATHPVAILKQRRQAVASMAEWLLASRASLVYCALDPTNIDSLPFLWAGFGVSLGYTYRVDLRQGMEAVARQFASPCRSRISKAQRDGLIVREITDNSVVESLVMQTFSRKRKNPKEEWLKRILYDYSNAENSYGYATFKGGKPAAAVFIVHDGKIGFNLLNGYDSRAGHSGAGALAMSRAIAHAHEIGLTHYDFEGSVLPEVEKYYCNFGGELTPYVIASRAWLPLEVALKLRYRGMF